MSAAGHAPERSAGPGRPAPAAPAGFDPHVLSQAYDDIAPDYAQKYGGDLEKLPLDTEILDLLARRARGRGPVLDVGCGPAQAGRYLAARGVRVVGIDLAPRMLAEALARRGSRQLAAAAADMRALPVASGSCAAIVSFYALHHLPRAEAAVALREFRRVLAPGGELAIATHEGDGEFVASRELGIRGTRYSAAELERALTRERFRVETVRTRDPLPHERQAGRIYITASLPPAAD